MSLPADESTLVIYSAAEERYCAALLDGFRAAHPDTSIEFRFGISVALHERYLAAVASGKPDADIVWSSAMDLQMALVRDGHAAPYRSPEAGRLPEGAVHADRAYATTLEPLATLVDTRCVPPDRPAGSLSDIAALIADDAAPLRDKLACFDIRHNGLGFLALMHESLHLPQFDVFMRALAQTKSTTCVSNPEMVDALASGRSAIGFHLLGSYAARAQQAHPHLSIAASSMPALAISRIAILPRSAPHPIAARRFLDFLLSREGQASLAKGGFRPIRSDAGVEDATTGMALRPISIGDGMPDLIDPQRRQAFLERWQRCIG